MIRLFEKARRWYDLGTDEYGDVLLLQVSLEGTLSLFAYSTLVV